MAAMEIVGFLERRASLKAYPLTYEVRGNDQSAMLQSVLNAMDHIGQRLSDLQTDTIGDIQRIAFPLTATRRQHERLQTELSTKADINKLLQFRDPEDD
jgi:putative Mg2+ transporter-C (MgtC) family protein